MAEGLRVDDVHKSFALGDQQVDVLRGASFEMDAGRNVAIIGPSGSGKSTLLHLLGALDRPTSGTIEVAGRQPYELPEPELARFRNDTIGFVFQDHHLLPQYSVLENVLIPTLAFPGSGPGGSAGALERAGKLLERVGLSHRLSHRPAALSGGERQRVAVARALINGPRLLLCDEPTGSLDHKNAQAVGELLFELHRQENNILIVVTHSLELAQSFERRLELQDGRCIDR